MTGRTSLDAYVTLLRLRVSTDTRSIVGDSVYLSASHRDTLGVGLDTETVMMWGGMKRDAYPKCDPDSSLGYSPRTFPWLTELNNINLGLGLG